MDTAEKYIYEVYSAKSFSNAAKTLFISQPSLSAVIAHKERELGFKIFDRRTKPISLTAEGQIYIEMLNEMIESERNMKHRVKRLSDGENKSISIGGSSASAYYLIPAVCGAFYRLYPDVEVMVDLGNFSANAEITERFSHFQKLDRGEMDAVFCYEYDSDKYEGECIYKERLVVAMHDDIVPPNLRKYELSRDELLSRRFDEKKLIKEKDLFSDVAFFAFDKSTNTGRHMTSILGGYSITTHKISYARHGVVHFNMMRAGVGAFLTSDCVIELSGFERENIKYFAFDEESSNRDIYIVRKKNAILGENVLNFISLAKEICRRGNKLEIYTNKK